MATNRTYLIPQTGPEWMPPQSGPGASTLEDSTWRSPGYWNYLGYDTSNMFQTVPTVSNSANPAWTNAPVIGNPATGGTPPPNNPSQWNSGTGRSYLIPQTGAEWLPPSSGPGASTLQDSTWRSPGYWNYLGYDTSNMFQTLPYPTPGYDPARPTTSMPPIPGGGQIPTQGGGQIPMPMQTAVMPKPATMPNLSGQNIAAAKPGYADAMSKVGNAMSAYPQASQYFQQQRNPYMNALLTKALMARRPTPMPATPPPGANTSPGIPYTPPNPTPTPGFGGGNMMPPQGGGGGWNGFLNKLLAGR